MMSPTTGLHSVAAVPETQAATSPTASAAVPSCVIILRPVTPCPLVVVVIVVELTLFVVLIAALTLAVFVAGLGFVLLDIIRFLLINRQRQKSPFLVYIPVLAQIKFLIIIINLLRLNLSGKTSRIPLPVAVGIDIGTCIICPGIHKTEGHLPIGNLLHLHRLVILPQ